MRLRSLATPFALLALTALALTSPPALAQNAVKLAWEPLNAESGSRFKLKAKLDGGSLTATAEIAFESDDQSEHVLRIGPTATAFIRRQNGHDPVVLASVNTTLGSLMPLEFTLARDTWRMSLITPEKVLLSACDDALPGKALKFGASETDLKLTDRVVQPIERIYYTDDFMRTGDQHGDWQVLSGDWAPSGVTEENGNTEKRPDPTKSANPFTYRVTHPKVEALAATGEWYWSDYRAEVSVRASCEAGGGDGDVALAALVQDKGAAYVAFEWHPGTADDARQIVLVDGDQRHTLASARGGWADDQWYSIGLEVTGGHVTAFIDGQPVLWADEDRVGQGKVGLLAQHVAVADFDDMLVEYRERFRDDFRRNSASEWQVIDGKMTIDPQAAMPRDAALPYTASGVGLLQPSADFKAVTGGTDWSDYKVSTTVRAAGTSSAVLVAGYKDARNFWYLTYGPGRPCDVGHVDNGQLTRYAATAVVAEANRPHTLAIELIDSYAKFTLDDRPLVADYDDNLASGRAGLMAYGPGVSFDDITVEPSKRLEPVTFTDQFTHEETMAGWASAEGSWHSDEVSQRGGILWHRGLFYNDVDVTIGGSQFGGKPRTLRLYLGGDGMTPKSGVCVMLAQAQPDSHAIAAQIQVDTMPVADPPGGALNVPADGTIRVSRRGMLWTVSVNDEVKFGVTADEGKLAQLHVPPQSIPAVMAALRASYWRPCIGLSTKGFEPDLEKIDARSVNLFDTTFVKAPVEWHTAKGLWETTGRWRCDPRWSFFGGRKNPNPLMWTKADYSGAQQVEAYMGIRMDMPGPPYYLHPSDLGLTLGGNGRDILSGVTFIFAANNNTCSQLWRNGRKIKENTGENSKFKYVGPQGEGLTKFHRHWFHLVLRRVANRLQAWCDDALLFDEADPVPDNYTNGVVTNPFRGKVGVFCVNNGVMVSRVKAWYEHEAAAQAFPDVAALQHDPALDAGSTGGDAYVNNFENGIGQFKQEEPQVPVSLGRQRRVGDNQGYALRVTNLSTGGTFGVTAVDQPFKVSERPKLEFVYCVPAGGRINCYLTARSGKVYVIALTEGDEPDADQTLLDKAPTRVADGQWHGYATKDLKALFEKAGASGDVTIEKIAFGMREPDPYLYAGFGANVFGTTWYLDQFSLTP